MKKENLFVILTGVVIGIAALVLTALGNPANMGFCIACFERDIAGAVGLHSAAKVQYVRPEIIGLVLGSFLMALASKEWKARAGSSPALRFVLGAFVMIGALAFLGCPLRMVLRLAGGDANALVGLVGFGDIGRKIATRLKGFGTTILAYDPYCTKENIEAFGCVPVSLDELLEQADFVSLHVRLSPQTQNMFGAAEFAKMKPTAIFVNAARAGLVDEAAMIDALEQKKIGGAVLDVFREEPLPVDHPLRKLKNVTLSAHLAGTDIGTFSGSIKIVADNLEQYFSGGELKNVVNH